MFGLNIVVAGVLGTFVLLLGLCLAAVLAPKRPLPPMPPSPLEWNDDTQRALADRARCR